MQSAVVLWRLREKAQDYDTEDAYIKQLYEKVMRTRTFKVTKGDSC